MKIKAVELRGRTVTSADGKARWTTNGQEHEVSDIVGADLLKKSPTGMFMVGSSTPVVGAKAKEDEVVETKSAFGKGKNKSMSSSFTK